MLTSPLDEEQLTHAKALASTLSPTAAAWVSGYFWRMAEEAPAATPASSGGLKAVAAAPDQPAVTLVSASQTGNARGVAERLRDQLVHQGIAVNLQSASEYSFKQIDQARLLLVVTSTQGEGEPPEEAYAFHKFVMSKKAPALVGTAFAVLGLGDSSYEHFCQTGKDFDMRLAALGAERLLARVDADVDYAEPAKQWCEDIAAALKARTPVVATSPQTALTGQQATTDYDKAHPFTAALSANQKITGRYSDKDVRHLEIDLSGSGLTYTPGDALGVWYDNDPALVETLIEGLTLSPETEVTVDGTRLPLRTALMQHRELTVNSPLLVKRFAEMSASGELSALAEGDKATLQAYVERTPLVDMLIDAQCRVSADQLVECLRPLTPRLYSIASSQAEVDDEVHLTVAVVRYDYHGQPRTGGASAYLAERVEEDGPVRVFIEPSPHFRLPDDTATPIIMIGAGTGIAPYRAFLQQRAHEQASGQHWLFFGNPHFTEDFLYQTEWQHYVKQGLLQRIDLAWSRDQADKVYVQDRLRTQGATVWEWIQQGAVLYVCGDAQRMARDVEQALMDILQQHGGLNEEAADDYLTELRLARRYQRDIY